MTKITLSSRTFLFATAATLAFGFASQAAAQTQEQAAPPQEDQSATDVDEEAIVITAQKREEKVLDIPQSVTVVGGETIERQHAATFEDYLNEIPALSLNQSEPGETRLVLRGVNTGGASSTVAVYVDETPFGSSSGLVNGAILAGDFDPFDLARIEVLRGPQGTLYGASSLGGVFKFVTNSPQLGEFSGRGRAGVEFINEGGTSYSANGVVNVPLGDKAAFRVTGTYRNDAGWVDADPQDILLPGFTIPQEPPALPIVVPDLTLSSIDDNNINDNKLWNGRASVLFEPTDKLKVRLTAYAQNMRTHSSASVEVDPDDLDPAREEFSQTVFIPEFNDIDYRIFSGEIEYDFGFANLLSATSYGKLKSSFRTDVTLLLGATVNLLYGPQHHPALSPFPQVTDQPLGSVQDQTTRVNKFTQEFRLASPSNDTFEWMAGFYYTNEDGLVDQHINGRALAGPNSFEDELHDLIFLTLDSKYEEIAGFANVTWHATDRFDITAGGRLSKNDQKSEQVVGGELAPIQFNGPIPIFEPGESDESVFTYSISPRYEVSDTTAVYARIAKGYRPGGPNAVPPLSDEELATFPLTYDADTLTSYEVGLKSDIGRRMSLDLAAYHLDWNDIQVLGRTPSGFGFNENGGGARVNGIEGTFTVRPLAGLRLSANGALIDAELTEDAPVIVGGLDGDTLPFTPKVSFGLNGDYEWNVSNAVVAFVGSSLRYSGEQRGSFRAGNLPQAHIPDYAALDLRAGAEFGQFTLEAYVRNLTDTRGITELTEGLPLPGGAISAAFIQPRTFGFTLGARF